MPTNRRVAIGETSSFRYIGVEPPIDDSLANQIHGEIIVPQWLSWFHGVRQEEGVKDGATHTEFGFDVGDTLDTYGPEKVDAATLEITYQIAELLEKLGDEIAVLDEQVTIDFRTPLFGEESDFNRLQAKQFRHQPYSV
jgi:hypothetical protein